MGIFPHMSSVADPDLDPAGSVPFWLDLDPDPDPDVWDRIRIRILALINDPISTFLVCVKAINTIEIYFAQLFGSFFLEYISVKKFPEETCPKFY
jgi:hypothetical protein